MQKEQHVLYILMGASGSGKTTLLQHIVYEERLCHAAKKYSNRRVRPSEEADGAIIKDDVRHLSLSALERKCDILYEINNYKYGVNSAEIIKCLDDLDSDSSKSKFGLFLILSDVRAIKLLKQKVEAGGHLVKVMYLLSRMDSSADFIRTWQKRVEEEMGALKSTSLAYRRLEKSNQTVAGILSEFSSKSYGGQPNVNIVKISDLCNRLTSALPQSETNKKRSEKIRLMFTQYVHNIGLFDHVILNTTTKDDMFKQAKNIIEFYNDTNKQRLAKHKLLKGPVIFVLCASPKSGKGTLMENLNIMGASQIQITPKYANRAPAANDKRDGMIALGKSGFEEKFEGEGEVWKWSFHTADNNSGGTKYAVKKDDIVKHLNKGISQIVVSNFEQLECITDENDTPLSHILNDLKARMIFIYLHRVRTDDETVQQIPDAVKQKEVQEIHARYIKNIANVDHVIINPNYLTYSEDLHDQMMSLIELYQGR